MKRELLEVGTRVRRQFYGLLLVVASVGPSNLVRAEEGTVDLVQAVLAHEQRFATFAAEIKTIQDARSDEPVVAESRRTVQWQQSLYESTCSRDSSTIPPRVTFRFVAANADGMTIFTPPMDVEQYSGRFRRPAGFQPYAILLQTLDYEGVLSRFLAANRAGPDGLVVEVGDAEDWEGIRSRKVRGTRQLPGSTRADVFDLRLAIDYGFLPCWGQLAELENGVSQPRKQSTATGFVDTGDGRWLMREVRSTILAADPSEKPSSVTSIVVAGEFLNSRPADELFRLPDFPGNPIVRRFDGNQLVSQSEYRPKPPKREPWPAWAIWLAINDVAVGVLIAFVMIRMLLHLLRRAFLRRAAA